MRYLSIDTNTPANYNKPAVYFIRLMKPNGEPVHIGRFLGTDKSGTLCIGQTKYMEGRRWAFEKALDTGNYHSEGYNWYTLYNDEWRPSRSFTEFIRKHAGGFNGIKRRIEYAYLKMGSKQKAVTEEVRYIKGYVKKYGEPPPLNGAIPKREDPKTWKTTRQAHY